MFNEILLNQLNHNERKVAESKYSCRNCWYTNGDATIVDVTQVGNQLEYSIITGCVVRRYK